MRALLTITGITDSDDSAVVHLTHMDGRKFEVHLPVDLTEPRFVGEITTDESERDAIDLACQAVG